MWVELTARLIGVSYGEEVEVHPGAVQGCPGDGVHVEAAPVDVLPEDRDPQRVIAVADEGLVATGRVQVRPPEPGQVVVRRVDERVRACRRPATEHHHEQQRTQPTRRPERDSAFVGMSSCAVPSPMAHSRLAS